MKVILETESNAVGLATLMVHHASTIQRYATRTLSAFQPVNAAVSMALMGMDTIAVQVI